MKLPEIAHPTYEVSILSRKAPIKVRPFLVKEQKILLMARESRELDAIVKSLKDIIRNCVLDKDVIVDDLPMIDLELIFLTLRAKSVGEVIDIHYQCKNVVDKDECNMVIEAQVDIGNLDITNKDWEKKSKIFFNDEKTVGAKLRLPTFEAIQKCALIEDDVERSYLMAAFCVEYIFDADQVYRAKDATTEEIVNFIENLTEDKYGLIEEALEECPVISKTVEKKCGKCGFDHKYVLEGLEDFFI